MKTNKRIYQNNWHLKENQVVLIIIEEIKEIHNDLNNDIKNNNKSI